MSDKRTDTDSRWSMTPVCYGTAPEGVTDDVIKGVAVVSEGEARGHGVQVNSDFVDDVIRMGNAKKGGVKSRFGHPTMSGSAMGTFVGRFKNFRRDDTVARADLVISPTAHETPQGDLAKYIKSMATNEPDMFGASIAFKDGEPFQIDDDGERMKPIADGEPIFETIESLKGVDIVDDPATNDGLFSAWSTDQLSAQVSTFLDAHPEVFELIQDKPDIIDGFMQRYEDYKSSYAKRINLNPTTEDTEMEDTTKDNKNVDAAGDAGTDDGASNAALSKKDADTEALSTAPTSGVPLEWIDEFGATEAVEYARAKLTHEQAREQHYAKIDQEKVELQTEIDKLKSDKDKANDDGADPVTFAAAEGEEDGDDPEKARKQAVYDKLSTRMPAGVAKFGAAYSFKR